MFLHKAFLHIYKSVTHTHEMRYTKPNEENNHKSISGLFGLLSLSLNIQTTPILYYKCK